MRAIRSTSKVHKGTLSYTFPDTECIQVYVYNIHSIHAYISVDTATCPVGQVHVPLHKLVDIGKQFLYTLGGKVQD